MRSTPNDFWLWFSKFNAEDLAGLTAGVLVIFAVIVGIICLTIYKIHQTRSENALKRDLLDRGLSATEIATIIGATPSRKGFSCGDRKGKVQL
jgi:hypothetical protein